jgi:hypothetical protein
MGNSQAKIVKELQYMRIVGYDKNLMIWYFISFYN